MTPDEIVMIVKKALGVDITCHTPCRRWDLKDARLLTVILMLEYEIKPPVIAAYIGRDRTLVYYAEKKASDLLESDKRFKQKYWACNEIRLEMEDAA